MREKTFSRELEFYYELYTVIDHFYCFFKKNKTDYTLSLLQTHLNFNKFHEKKIENILQILEIICKPFLILLGKENKNFNQWIISFSNPAITKVYVDSSWISFLFFFSLFIYSLDSKEKKS